VSSRLNLFTIPPHRAFADALAAGLIDRFGGDPLRLARGVVLLPNNRAKRSISDAFVRASGGGLLLPRLVAIGDPELDESVGALFDPADGDTPVAPAVEPLQRRMILARLIQAEGGPSDAAEAVRLAADLARTLDQLLVEEVEPGRLRKLDLAEGLSEHWDRALRLFEVVLKRWPSELARLGRIDLAERRSKLLDRVVRRWQDSALSGFVCAAGITASAPAIARLLRAVAELSEGLVVLPGIATVMDDAEWASLGPHPADPVTGRRQRATETHPQFHLKLLLERMRVNRNDVRDWRHASEHDAMPSRTKAITSALAPPAFTAQWSALPASARRLDGVRRLEVATPAEEAQAIALALRETLETEGKTAALVTPDRALGRRVAAHCARWGIALDDSAGLPLSLLPPGTLLLALADAAAQAFAPVPLLTLLKHPLVRLGEERLAWLDGARALDRALRGPRPAPGLDGVDAFLAGDAARDRAVRGEAREWWKIVQPLLAPIETAFGGGPQPLAMLVAALRETASTLGGDALWSRTEGRAAADLLDTLEREAVHGPALVEPRELAPMLRNLMDEVAVRPPQGGHPRLAILGLLEARLQTADLMILGGLNEGVWPGLPAPDPWLSPRIRAELGLPGLERRIGLSAHDLAGALGAPQVLLTRARRDASAPTIASRFWLRLEALSGGLEGADELAHWLRAIDAPERYEPARRPAPAPAIADRPRVLSVTEVDRLKADPYAFYARRMLRLAPLDAVDADPTAAWRGTAVHEVLERWAREDACDPAKLRERALAMLADERTHPLMRALWQPRLIEAIEWIAREMAAQSAAGRRVLAVEQDGQIDVAGVTLRGKFDRIDRLPGGKLAIVDYKTGMPPTNKAARAGFSLQLGLLAMIAERGGFEGISGSAERFEYWSLAKDAGGSFGYIRSPADSKRDPIPADEFVAAATHHFTEAVATWLTGSAAFTAKLVPEYAPYAEYDQLMRRDEWYGRE